MRYLRKNTAVIITVGPFLDPGDGVTPETALTVTSCHITMTLDDDDGTTVNLIIDVNATASGGDNDMGHIANDDAGFYWLELTAAQTNYNGRAMIAITDATNHCPVFHEFTILPQQVYDSLIAGSDLLDANASQVGGTTQTGVDIGGTGVPITGDLTSTMKTSVNGEVVDVMATDTHTQPGQEAPPATATFEEILTYLYKLLRNKSTQSAGQLSIYDDAGTTVDHKATVSDDGSTLTRGELQSGP